MSVPIQMKSAGGAERVADQALRTFRRETEPLDPYLEGILVSLEEAPGPEGRERMLVRVRVDFRSGGRYLVETQGEDWVGLLPFAAKQAARGASIALRQRWELSEP